MINALAEKFGLTHRFDSVIAVENMPGPTGETKLWFKKRQTRFVSYAEEDHYAESAYA